MNIPWRSRDGKGTDLKAWAEVYHQFGLVRPLLHRSKKSKAEKEEWRIEETSNLLDHVGDEEGDQGSGAT